MKNTSLGVKNENPKERGWWFMPHAIISLFRMIFCREQYHREVVARNLAHRLVHLRIISADKQDFFIQDLLKTNLSSDSIQKIGNSIIANKLKRQRQKKQSLRKTI